MIKVEKFYPLILEAFNENKTFSFPVKGSSMRPLLKNDDVVTICKIDTYKVGDILFFRRDDGAFVLHRLRKIKNDVNNLDLILSSDDYFEIKNIGNKINEIRE